MVSIILFYYYFIMLVILNGSLKEMTEIEIWLSSLYCRTPRDFFYFFGTNQQNKVNRLPPLKKAYL